MLIAAERSRLLIVDVQEKLVPTIHESARVIANCEWLAKLANRLDVPVIASEQYTKGLGPTVPQLKTLLDDDGIGHKVHFSCVAADCLKNLPGAGRDQTIVAGIEAHVCVLQTAFDLNRAGNEVFVVADAISSRSPHDAALAIERMRGAGITIVTREMVFFEWLRQAGTQRFKELSAEFVR
ncbi:MAG: hydrolase [Burkholderiales bacterium]